MSATTPSDLGTSTSTAQGTTSSRETLSAAEKGGTLGDDAFDGSQSDNKSLRFWLVLAALSITGFLTTLESTIITSALPTITNTLGGGNQYVWVPNAFMLAFILVLPVFAQVADIFGRRWPLLAAVAMFLLGSGICGGASSMDMLIAGRALQGMGGGGITLLIEVVVSDLVSLRERGKYMAITLSSSIVGLAAGPFIGGLIVERSSWRWIFYLNLPAAAVCLVCLFAFLRVQTHYPGSSKKAWTTVLARIDTTGNAIFATAAVAVLLALTWGGTLHGWGDYRVIVPLVLGLVGLGLWVAFEWTWSKAPSFPLQIVSNRTSSAVLGITFFHSLLTHWSFYFVPLYFQCVKQRGPSQAGIDSLPLFLVFLPAAVVGGGLLSKWGRYKPLHLIGWALIIIASGLFSLLDAGSSTAEFVIFQLLFGIGGGMVAVILIPAMQASLDESLVALSTGVWTFARFFGGLWGIAIPSAIFNNEARVHAERIVTDPQIAAMLTGGKAYDRATKAFLDSIGDAVTKGQVVEVFSQSMRTLWRVSLVCACLGFLITYIEKEIPLRKEVKNEYTMENLKKKARE